jgi:hypothetical protein
MRLKMLLAVLFVAGLAASIAFAAPTSRTDTSTTTTTTKKVKCEQVELKGSATAGSVTFTVTKANKRGKSLVGSSATLTIPPGAKVKAKACTTAGSATLTLRDLHVKAHTP